MLYHTIQASWNPEAGVTNFSHSFNKYFSMA